MAKAEVLAEMAESSLLQFATDAEEEQATTKKKKQAAVVAAAAVATAVKARELVENSAPLRSLGLQRFHFHPRDPQCRLLSAFSRGCSSPATL